MKRDDFIDEFVKGKLECDMELLKNITLHRPPKYDYKLFLDDYQNYLNHSNILDAYDKFEEAMKKICRLTPEQIQYSNWSDIYDLPNGNIKTPYSIDDNKYKVKVDVKTLYDLYSLDSTQKESLIIFDPEYENKLESFLNKIRVKFENCISIIEKIKIDDLQNNAFSFQTSGDSSEVKNIKIHIIKKSKKVL